MESYVSQLEGRLAERCPVLELPLVPYPESPPVNGMTDYSHLWTYVYSEGLRWSYGGLKGTSNGQWGQDAADDPSALAARAQEAGFCGVQVDTKSFASDADLVKYLEALGYPDLTSSSGRWLYFDLGGFVGDEFYYEPAGGFSSREVDREGRPYWWMTSPSATVAVWGAANETIAVGLDLVAPPCGSVVLKVNGKAARVKGKARIERRAKLDKKGRGQVLIESITAACTVDTDPRPFYVGLREAQ